MPPALKQLEELAAEGLAEARLEIRRHQDPGRSPALGPFGDRPGRRPEGRGGAGPRAVAEGSLRRAGPSHQGPPGFCPQPGIDVADVVQQEVKGVPYVFADKVEAGRPAQEVLPRLLRDWLARLSFPSPCAGAGRKPLCPAHPLAGGLWPEVLPLEFAGVRPVIPAAGTAFWRRNRCPSTSPAGEEALPGHGSSPIPAPPGADLE